MHFETSEQEGVTVITLTRSRVDASVATDLRTALAAAATGRKFIAIDLSKVTFIDSSGLGALVAVLKAAGRESKVCITGLSPTVATLFRLTRMDKVFQVQPNLPQALQVLSPLKAA
jgi:anti-sigma B factor antagonist